MSVCQNQWACFALALALTCLCCFSSWHILNIFQLNHQHFVRSVARPYRVFKRNSKNNGAEFYICPLPSPAPPPLSTVHFMARASKLNFNFSHLISIIMSVPHVSWLQYWIHAKIVKNKLLSTKSDVKTIELFWAKVYFVVCAKAWAQIEKIWCGKNACMHTVRSWLCRWHNTTQS